MKQKSLITILDIFSFFIIFLLMGSGVNLLKTSIPIGILIIVSALSLVINYILNFLVKTKYNGMVKEQRKTEEQLETGETEVNHRYTIIKGEVLELMIFNKLKSLYPEAIIYRNVKCPKMYGEDAEIDILMIYDKGIYIIEAKNFAGTYTGDWSKDKINIQYQSGQVFEVYNPVIQNSFHYKYLQSISGFKSKYFRNVVVIGQNTYYKEDEVRKTMPSYGYITNIYKIQNTINFINSRKPVVLSDSEKSSFSQIVKENMIDQKSKSVVGDTS